MRARSARPGVGFPVREIRGEAPSENLIQKPYKNVESFFKNTFFSKIDKDCKRKTVLEFKNCSE
jgi:hypothetical protein